MRKWGVCSVRQPAEGSSWGWALVASASTASNAAHSAAGVVRAGSPAARARVPACRSQPPAATDDSTLDAMRTGAQASIGPFDAPICRIDWQTVTLAPCGAFPAVTASAYCGRGNDVGASFCMDCGKPLGTAMAVKATATVGATPAVPLGGGGLGGGGA